MKAITNSQASCYRSCPRKHKFRYVDMRRPLVKKSALRLGGLMHEALERWLVEGHELSSVITRFGEEEKLDDFDRSKLIAMMYGYHIAYKDDGLEPLAVEVEFDIPLINPATGRASQTWRVVGKMDAIVKLDGKIWVMEHKTTSKDIEPGSVYWQQLRLDSQVSTYFTAAKQMGYEVAGVLYDAIRKPRLKPRSATPEEKRRYNKNGLLDKRQRLEDETPVEFTSRLMEEIAKDPCSYYVRSELLQGEVEQEEAAFDLWQTAKIVHESYKTNRWPRNPGNCFYWNSQCDYFDVCTGVASIDDNLRFRTAGEEHEELSSIVAG